MTGQWLAVAYAIGLFALLLFSNRFNDKEPIRLAWVNYALAMVVSAFGSLPIPFLYQFCNIVAWLLIANGAFKLSRLADSGTASDQDSFR